MVCSRTNASIPVILCVCIVCSCDVTRLNYFIATKSCCYESLMISHSCLHDPSSTIIAVTVISFSTYGFSTCLSLAKLSMSFSLIVRFPGYLDSTSMNSSMCVSAAHFLISSSKSPFPCFNSVFSISIKVVVLII